MQREAKEDEDTANDTRGRTDSGVCFHGACRGRQPLQQGGAGKQLHRLRPAPGLFRDDSAQRAYYKTRKQLPCPTGYHPETRWSACLLWFPQKYLQEFRSRWNEGLSSRMGETRRKMLALFGKTQRGNGRAGRQANHIVSAAANDGFCVGEVLVDGKSNEITGIPRLLDTVTIQGKIVTIDAIGCRKKSSVEYGRNELITCLY